MNPQNNINQAGNTSTDHDNLVTLISEVKTLAKGQDEIKKSQDAFHSEMRDTLARLQDSTGSRVSDCEKRIANLEVTRVDFREKLASNKTLFSFIIAIGIVLVAMMVWHLTGYHI